MQKINKTFILSIILFTLFLSGFLFLFIQIKNLKEEVSVLSKKPSVIVGTNNESNLDILKKIDCSDTCKKEIGALIAQAVSSVSAIKTVTKVTSALPTENKTAFIPLSGPITSTSTSWVDAVGTDVYIDLANDYGKNAKVTWEAFLKVANGNGQAFARLFDVTHGIAVDGSEISLTNNAVSTQVYSGNLNFWSGRNLYRVQIKSLNSFEVTFGSGRIKISY